jgi:hypothetical protein
MLPTKTVQKHRRFTQLDRQQKFSAPSHFCSSQCEEGKTLQDQDILCHHCCLSADLSARTGRSIEQRSHIPGGLASLSSLSHTAATVRMAMTMRLDTSRAVPGRWSCRRSVPAAFSPEGPYLYHFAGPRSLAAVASLLTFRARPDGLLRSPRHGGETAVSSDHCSPATAWSGASNSVM